MAALPAAEGVALLHAPGIVEDHHRDASFQHHERLRFGRIAVAMRGDVRAAQQDVEQAGRVLLERGVEVEVHAPPRGRDRLAEHALEQRRGHQLHAVGHLNDDDTRSAPHQAY